MHGEPLNYILMVTIIITIVTSFAYSQICENAQTIKWNNIEILLAKSFHPIHSVHDLSIFFGFSLGF